MGVFFNSYTTLKEETEILNEVYFGKKSRILEMEKIIGRIRADTNIFMSGKANSNPLVLQFNRLMEEEFGFECFSLYILQMHMTNAMTMPVANKLDVWDEHKHIYSTTKEGFKFDKSAGYSTFVMVTTGVLGNDNFTDGEIMALVLHEVGHSFANAISGTSCSFGFARKGLTALLYISQVISSIFMPLAIPATIVTSFLVFNKGIKKIAEFVNKQNKRNGPIWKIFNFMQDIRSIITTFSIEVNQINALLNPLAVMMNKSINLIYRVSNPWNLIRSLMGYNDEKVSDNFATMYGYGPELASGMRKIDNEQMGLISRKIAYDIPIIGHMYRIMEIPFEFLGHPFECHPQSAERVADQLRYMENELKRGDIDPKMKKIIQQQIEQCKDELDELTNANKKLSAMDPKLVNVVYDRFLMYCFKGDIRELFYNSQRNYDDYNRAMEDAIEAGKRKNK